MNNLVVKIGALGDVLRTTPIFRVLKGKNYLLSDKRTKEFIPEGRFIKKIIEVEKKERLENIYFDLVLNLEENEEIAVFIKRKLRFKNLIGVYYDDKKNKLSYTKESRKWFDMSLISRFGIKKANELKFKNRKTYQELHFEMIGKKFNGEKYLLKIPKTKNIIKNSVAIQSTVGEKWPMKAWPFYGDLSKILEKRGFKVYFLKHRKRIKDYINDINKCEILISGDTLAMHIGLALKKKILAIFTCTSPWEIYDYGRMVKVISPRFKEAFYKREYIKELAEAIDINHVLIGFNRLLNKL